MPMRVIVYCSLNCNRLWVQKRMSEIHVNIIVNIRQKSLICKYIYECKKSFTSSEKAAMRQGSRQSTRYHHNSCIDVQHHQKETFWHKITGLYICTQLYSPKDPECYKLMNRHILMQKSNSWQLKQKYEESKQAVMGAIDGEVASTGLRRPKSSKIIGKKFADLVIAVTIHKHRQKNNPNMNLRSNMNFMRKAPEIFQLNTVMLNGICSGTKRKIDASKTEALNFYSSKSSGSQSRQPIAEGQGFQAEK